MRTDDLIRRLGSELQPVRPLPSPWRRASVWTGCAFVYVAVIVIQAWIRHGAIGVTADLPDIVQQVALGASAVAAAVAAFMSVIPGASSRAPALTLVFVLVMMAALAWGALSDVRTLGTLGVGRETDWPCVISISVGGFALWGLATVMLRRGAPLTPGITSLLAGAAALSVANIEACLGRPHTFTMTIVVWHGVTSALVLAAVVTLGRSVFTWRRRVPA
jgi:hypothetical protein